MASNAALTRRRRQGDAKMKEETRAGTEVLEVRVADKRLDALIEEEQRSKASSSSPRRSM